MHLLLLLILISFCCSINSLKCRSQDGASDAEMKRITRSCMQRSSSSSSNSNSNNNNNNQDDNERRYGNQRYNFDNPYNEQDYGQVSGPGQRQQQAYDNRWQRSLKQSEMSNSKVNATGSELGSCVAQCFFEELNMVDANGQPDRRKVSYLLTKDMRDRELRNFYMDTVQQCFRYLEQSRYNNNNSKCNQARELIKCMTEYAKAQCDDWDDYSNMIFN